MRPASCDILLLSLRLGYVLEDFADTQLISYSSISATGSDILLAQCLCELELVPLYSMPSLLPLPDT